MARNIFTGQEIDSSQPKDTLGVNDAGQSLSEALATPKAAPVEKPSGVQNFLDSTDNVLDYTGAPMGAISNLLLPLFTAPAAGVAGLGSLAAPVPEDAPEDARYNRAKQISEAILQLGQNTTPQVQALTQPVQEFLQKTLGKFAEGVGDRYLNYLQEPLTIKSGDREYSVGPVPPEIAAGAASVAHSATEFGGFVEGASVLGRIKHSIRGKKISTFTKDSAKAAEVSNFSSDFQAALNANPDLSVGQFIRKYPQFKEEAFQYFVDPKSTQSASPEPDAAETVGKSDFAKVADEFDGYENIPENHPIFKSMTSEELLQAVNEYDNVITPEPAKESPPKSNEPRAKTFKGRVEQKVKELGSLKAVEEHYAGTKAEGLAKSIANKLYGGPEATTEVPIGEEPPAEATPPEATPEKGANQEDTARVQEKEITESVEEPVVENASGESAASLEALSVEKSRKTQGIKHYVLDSRNPQTSLRPAIGPRPEDNPLNAYDVLVQEKDGSVQIVNKGDKAKSVDVSAIDFPVEAKPKKSLSEVLRKKIANRELKLRPASEIRGAVPKEPVVEDISGYDSVEAAEEDFTLQAKTYPSEAEAQKQAESLGEGWEVVKIGDEYKVGQDLLFDPTEYDTEAIAKAAESPVVEEAAPVQKREVIKVESFTKAGDIYIGSVDNSRSVAIVKNGPKDYEAFLGTAEEIQAGTAEPVGQFTSLPKAKKAFGSKEGKEITIKEKLDPDEIISYLRDQVETYKAAETPKDELARLMQEQEDDLLGEENIVSWEELAEEEAVEEYDEDNYYSSRDIGDVASDLLTLFGDDRGAINPRTNPEILAAKKRLKNDVRNLRKISTKLKGKLKPEMEIEPPETESLWSLFKRVLNNERGYISGERSPFANAVKELFEAIKRAYKGLKKAAKAAKDWSLSDRRSSPYGQYKSSEREYMLGEAVDTTSKLVKAFKTDSSKAVRDLVASMEADRRIVPTHDLTNPNPPIRQEPQVPKVAPQLKPKVEKIAPHLLGKLQSPSHILGRLFDLENNPVTDVMESSMAFINNWHNSERWATGVLKGVPDSTLDLRKELDDLYAEVKPLVQAKARGDRRIANLRQAAANTQDEAKRRDLEIQIMVEEKKQIRRSKKIQDELFARYDSQVKGLAEKHSDVRIILQAAEELPEGITLTPKELKAAKYIRKFLDTTRDKLESVGIPVIKDRTYMHRMIPDVLNDPDAQGFLADQKVPVILKFLHQNQEGRLWYPSAHMILKHYIPMVERKIAFQPFLNRWRVAIDELPPDISDYMNRWVEANLLAKPRDVWQRALDKVVAFQYVRLIGGSLSVAFKHLTKIADTFSRFDSITNVKAVNATLKAIGQAAAEKVGVKGNDNAERKLMRAFVNSRAMVRLMDESPGVGVLAQKFKYLISAPTMAVETFDNGVSILATTIAAASSGRLTPQQTSRIIWETVLTANFRGGWDQPLFYKRVIGRILGMFQMTPFKLFEYRAELAQKALRGEVDHFGTKYSTMLLRYIFLMGMAETISRFFGNSLIDQIAHFPYVSHILKGKKDAPFYELHEPTLSTSPMLEWATQMGDKGIYSGTKEHLQYWGQFSKTYQMFHNNYPTSYYQSPLSHMLGIQKLDAGKGKKSKNSGRGGRGSRGSRGSR